MGRWVCGLVWILFIPLLILFPYDTIAQEQSDDLLIVNKKINKLAFYEDGKLKEVFAVATGRTMDLTPEGQFKIVNKIKNRPYYTDNIPGGSPDNPLGDRWLGLNARGTWGTTYAIHGNNNKYSIGKYVSAGCIRMYNDEIHWLFERVQVGTPVLVTTSKKSFDELAIGAGYSLKLPDIVETTSTITTFIELSLYEKPHELYKTSLSLAPQKLQVNAKTDDGNWYRVNTWVGNHWIQNEKILQGELVKEAVDVSLTENTLIFKSPFSANQVGALAPQTVKSFEHIGDWYHIESWLGDVWLKQGAVE